MCNPEKKKDKSMSHTKIPIQFLVALLISTLACATVTRMVSPQDAPPGPQQTEPSVAKAEPIATVALFPPEAGLVRGKPDAPAKIEVFEDLQCPACLNYTKDIEPLVLKELVDTGKAFYVFRHYPFLDAGAPDGESHQAANASLCASEQGKFWEYKTEVFSNWAGENAGAYSDKNLATFAKNVNLNMDAFNACFKENRYRKLIETDVAEGKGMGVQGTPSVFVNGTLLTPGYIPSFEDIKNAVESVKQ
jgi:protein-disulfide isomerase